MADDDEDLEWEEFMELADEQAEAVADREMARYQRMLDSMTPAQWYRYQRGSALRSIAEARRFLAEPMPNGHDRFECIDDVQRRRLASSRVRLVKLRTFRSTGVWPGTA